MSVTLSIPFRAFRNKLCILRSLDMHELVKAGVLSTLGEWQRFDVDPYRFFLKADDEVAARLWRLMQERMPAELQAT